MISKLFCCWLVWRVKKMYTSLQRIRFYMHVVSCCDGEMSVELRSWLIFIIARQSSFSASYSLQSGYYFFFYLWHFIWTQEAVLCGSLLETKQAE
ncbi:hypothetical protein T4E_8353 [Trichinella pseudospiralis]|uniref:Uncharacterized protein n=1 Tax=Trichinella pseudospiralis TaxID=6337 RepID=A0A0V0Y5R8_TRIPS|nr:hypothetical protein T4E_8353 [Trichinella pseudospiralis]